MNILDPQGPIAAAQKTILIDSVGIMLAIVLPTIAAIFIFAFWFRQSNPRATYLPDWAHSGRIELVVWSIPALTVILLGGVVIFHVDLTHMDVPATLMVLSVSVAIFLAFGVLSASALLP